MLRGQLHKAGVRLVGWRDVPTDDAACGKLSRSSMPRIEQVFVEGDNDDEQAFDRALFLARRRSEQRLHDVRDFYVATLSSQLIGYKGMVLPSHLRQLYPDLSRPELSARCVVFHQRFSTNTFPSWPLAHPFRRLAHNGEINSIEGNRRWAQARMARGPRRCSTSPGSSTGHDARFDSQSLDNMLEWLLLGGMDIRRRCAS